MSSNPERKLRRRMMRRLYGKRPKVRRIPVEDFGDHGGRAHTVYSFQQKGAPSREARRERIRLTRGRVNR